MEKSEINYLESTMPLHGWRCMFHHAITMSMLSRQAQCGLMPPVMHGKEAMPPFSEWEGINNATLSLTLRAIDLVVHLRFNAVRGQYGTSISSSIT